MFNSIPYMVITTSDVKKFQDRIFKECQKNIVKKGNDYSGLSEDTFANIRLASDLKVVESPAYSSITRGLDKVMRIINLTNPRLKMKVKDESLEDTLSDLINYFTYAVLLDKEMRKRIQRK